MTTPLRSAARSTPRRGAVLLEFALVSLALYLVFAALIGLGRWMALTQSAQDVARTAAREIALYPLPADFTFAQALADPGFQQAVYSDDHLVVDLDANPPGPLLEARFAGMPVVNRALRPLMIVSNVNVGGDRRRILHVPGAVIDSATSPSLLTIAIPRVDARNPVTGAEMTIALTPFLEEIGAGSFSASSADRGLVAVRVQVPYQSATLAAYLPDAPINQAIVATDLDGGGYAIVGPGPEGSGPYSGTYGLGSHQSLGQLIRPFRRLVTAQAIFRREVYL